MKVAIIVLLVIAGLFVALMFTGNKKNQGAQGSGGSPDPDTFSADDYPAVGWLGSALGAFSPKLTVAQIQPAVAQYNMQTQANYSLRIAADAKNKFRSAKFAVPVVGGQRCAHLVYKSAEAPPTGLDSLKEQDSEKLGASDKAKPKTEISFTILSSGGQITIGRNTQSGQGCVARLVK
ncbi:MAG TPA: hypothetical protein VGL22_05545 [Terracidiphilus sp.]|jgi:hypothetical protein